MAASFIWPGIRYLYAIGNTAAVSLSRDLHPTQDASILLLGCGDMRSILYTLHCEPDEANRKLEVTCVDFEPAILARNTLIFSLIIDNQPVDAIFDIYLHIYLEKSSLDLLTSQCHKLLSASETISQWKASEYGRAIQVSTSHTLTELRDLWQKWATMHQDPETLSKIAKGFRAEMNRIANEDFCQGHVSRSAGPLMVLSQPLLSEGFRNFWRTGTTFTSPSRISASNLLNPTFVYTQLGGTQFRVHYGSHPFIPFHLASIFGNATKSLSQSDIVRGVRTQFSQWCEGFHRAYQRNLVVIRLFFAGAIEACRALQALSGGTTRTRLPVCHWRTQVIVLDEAQKVPTAYNFDVIDTSNLDDHVGLLNVFTAAIPLLKPSCHSIIYMESLLALASNAQKDFAKRIHSDLSFMSLLLGISPVDYVTGYSSRSNTHELMTYNAYSSKKKPPQFHQVTTWKVVEPRSPVPIFDPEQLGTFLYDLYHSLFEEEDSETFWKNHKRDALRAIGSNGIFHYVRESFVMFLRVVRDRLRIPSEMWISIMDKFTTLAMADTSMKMDTVNYHDLCSCLHYHGVYTILPYRIDAGRPPTGIFKAWPSVPSLVRIFLTVPREALRVLQAEVRNTPILVGSQSGPRMFNVFSSLQATFGTATATGTPANPGVFIEEDPLGFSGSRPLILSFVMPNMLLTGYGPNYDRPEDLRINFGVKSNPANSHHFISKLGPSLIVHSASLLDKSAVIILPENPLPKAAPPAPTLSSCRGDVGVQESVNVALTSECNRLSSFTSKISVSNPESRKAFLSPGCIPTVEAISECAVRLGLDGIEQDIYFPLPIDAPQHRLRLARKSSWIEIIVPVKDTRKPDGNSVDPFPLIPTGPAPWSIHRINLERAPRLNIQGRKLSDWLMPHLNMAFSRREVREMEKKSEDSEVMTFMKRSIYTIMAESAGLQTKKNSTSRRLFTLVDKESNNSDLVMFIDGLRYDLPAHTMVCDTYVLPLTKARLEKIKGPFGNLLARGNPTQIGLDKGEVVLWKKLLPALVERCRDWNHLESCEYATTKRIPLTVEMEKNPLCACGEGMNVKGMESVELWKPLAKYSTRAALSPLFAVSYLVSVGQSKQTCVVCKGPGHHACEKCKKDRYCGRDCQKKDWKRHKAKYHPSKTD